MEDKRITAEQILAEIGIDVEQMAQKVADAINNVVVIMEANCVVWKCLCFKAVTKTSNYIYTTVWL